jgi:hypothetical protein
MHPQMPTRRMRADIHERWWLNPKGSAVQRFSPLLRNFGLPARQVCSCTYEEPVR